MARGRWISCYRRGVTGELSRPRFGVRLARVAPFFVLVLVNVAFFGGHYRGDFVFPWDFLNGYHAMAYAAAADGGVMTPELWSPYGSMGFPTHLAPQNSAFYPPLEALRLVDLRYTLGVAVWMQCIHVLLGAVGLFLLLRRNGLTPLAAVTGGILFQLSVGFFSNAQHVDIIRGYSLLPWVFLAISANVLTSVPRAGLSAWVLFGFVTGAYPGVIIASAYGCLVFFASELLGLANARDRRRYLGMGMLAGVLALMLSAVKFLPLLGLRDELFHYWPWQGVPLKNFLTLLFRFDVQVLPGDITMRSLYLPATALALIGLSAKLDRLWLTGLALSLTMMLFTIDESATRRPLLGLPGLRVSRFHISDFRALLHLGIIFMACSSLHRLIQARLSWRQLGVRAALLAFALVGAAWGALSYGYTARDVQSELMTATASLLVGLGAGRFLSPRTPRLLRGTAIAFLWLATGVGAYVYSMHAPQTWRFGDYHHRLAARASVSIDQTRPRQTAWAYRPARIGLVHMQGSNRGYYTQEFSQTGQDNADRLHRNTNAQKLLREDSTTGVARFLTSRSRALLVDDLGTETIEALLVECESHSFCPDTPENSARMLNFGISSARYRIDSDGTRWLVENELFFPGWRSRLCNGMDCREGPAAAQTSISLRAWSLPAGRYELETYYEPPYWSLARGLFWAATAFSVLAIAGGRGQYAGRYLRTAVERAGS